MADTVDQLLRSRCVASFSTDRRYLAIVMQNGSLRIWQTVTNMLVREFVPQSHLSSRILAVCWLPPGVAHASTLSSNTNSKKKRKTANGVKLTSGDTNENTHVLLGLAQGGVLLYDILTGDFQKLLNSDRYEKITGISVADDVSHANMTTKFLPCYAVSQSGEILFINTHEFSIENSLRQSNDIKDTALYSCCLIDENRKLVVGGRGTLSLWSLPHAGLDDAPKKQHLQLLWSTTAHANPILHLTRAQTCYGVSNDTSDHSKLNGLQHSDSEYFVAAANNEQWLSIWRVNAEDSNFPVQQGSLSFAEQQIAHLNVVVYEKHASSPAVEADEVSSNSDAPAASSSLKTSQLHLTASVCSSSGKLFVYNVRLRARAKKRSPKPPQCVVRFATNAERKTNKTKSTTIPVIATQPYATSAASTGNIEIAVAYGGNANGLAVEVISVDKLPPPTAEGEDIVLLRKDPATSARSEFSVVDGINVHDVPSGVGNVGKKRFNDTLEPLVVAPGLQTSKPAVSGSQRTVMPTTTLDDEDEAEREIDPSVMTVADQLRLIEGDEVKNKASNTVQASGLLELIKQGLLSQDRELIASVINRSDSAIITKTISKLSVSNVVPLLSAIVTNVTSHKAVHDAAPCLWLKQLLITHGTFLATAPGARVHLNSLASILDARLRTFHSLLRVKGKLELMAAQRKAAKRVATRTRRARHQSDSGGDATGASGKISISAALSSSSHAVAAVVHESDDDDDEENQVGGRDDMLGSSTAKAGTDDEDDVEDDEEVASDGDSDNADEFFGKMRGKNRLNDDVDEEEEEEENVDEDADLVMDEEEDDEGDDIAEDDEDDDE